MTADSRKPVNQPGISIITCTNRRGYMHNLFHNYARQRHAQKELIVVINDQNMALAPYRQLARKYRGIRIFRLPKQRSLGACLNFAVRQTRFPYIAKFDDDDFYAPHYVADCLQAFKRSRADVIGKRAHYMYLQGSSTLLLRFPKAEHRMVTRIPGATLAFKRKVIEHVQFPNRSVGEDDEFCLRSRRKGFKVYSAGKYNFVAIRRRNSANHTWIISDRELIAHHRKIPRVRNYKQFIQRNPAGRRI